MPNPKQPEPVVVDSMVRDFLTRAREYNVAACVVYSYAQAGFPVFKRIEDANNVAPAARQTFLEALCAPSEAMQLGAAQWLHALSEPVYAALGTRCPICLENGHAWESLDAATQMKHIVLARALAAILRQVAQIESELPLCTSF